jgi:hypothetical protein
MLTYELSQRLVIRQSVKALKEAIFFHDLGWSMESLEDIYTSALAVRVFQDSEVVSSWQVTLQLFLCGGIVLQNGIIRDAIAPIQPVQLLVVHQF